MVLWPTLRLWWLFLTNHRDPLELYWESKTSIHRCRCRNQLSREWYATRILFSSFLCFFLCIYFVFHFHSKIHPLHSLPGYTTKNINISLCLLFLSNSKPDPAIGSHSSNFRLSEWTQTQLEPLNSGLIKYERCETWKEDSDRWVWIKCHSQIKYREKEQCLYKLICTKWV